MNRNRRARAHLFVEGVLFVWHEIRSGHWGQFGLSFEGYLANNLIERKYKGEKLLFVLEFLLHISLREANERILDIVVATHADALPWTALSDEILERLRRHAATRVGPEYARVGAEAEREIGARRA